MPEKIVVPAHTEPKAADRLRQILLGLTRYLTPDQTGVAFVEYPSGLEGSDMVTKVTIRFKDGRCLATRFYRFYTSGGVVREEFRSREQTQLPGGWKGGVYAILRDARQAYDDYDKFLRQDRDELQRIAGQLEHELTV